MWKGSICYAGAIYYAPRSIPSEKKSFEVAIFGVIYNCMELMLKLFLDSCDFGKYLYREFVWKKIEKF